MSTTLPKFDARRPDEMAGWKILPAPLTAEEFVARCPEDLRAEWVRGEVQVMSPVNQIHTGIAVFLIFVLHGWVIRKKWGRLLGSEFAVKLPSRKTVRVPDVMCVSNLRAEIITENCLSGPPDVAFEIVSPESRERDYDEKFQEYEQSGVAEYWIIDPERQQVTAYELHAGAYRPIPEQEGRISSVQMAGFWLRPEWLWTQPPADGFTVLRELGVLN